MKNLFVLFTLLLLSIAAASAQNVPDPGATQDAEAARQKLLKAADQLDNIQANSESTKISVEDMKAQIATLKQTVASLQTENASLNQKLSDLQAAFDKAQADHAKEQKTLIDSVAGMIAANKAAAPAATPKPKKKEKPAPTASSDPAPDATAATEPKPEEAKPKPETALAPPADTSQPAPVKTQKGYYHIVASGETLTLICNAYREQGVMVSVADVRKANGLTDKSVLKVGQKLFIPKPGT